MNVVWDASKKEKLAALVMASETWSNIALKLGVSISAAKAANQRHLVGRAEETSELISARNSKRLGDQREWHRLNSERRASERRLRRATKKSTHKKQETDFNLDDDWLYFEDQVKRWDDDDEGDGYDAPNEP